MIGVTYGGILHDRSEKNWRLLSNAEETAEPGRWMTMRHSIADYQGFVDDMTHVSQWH